MQSEDITFNFENIYIEEKFKDNKNIETILSNIKSYKSISYVDDITKLLKGSPHSHPKDLSNNLLLSGIRGDILRRCPGTNGHICCNYYVINLYIGCPLGCTYCILQSYLNQPLTIINVDLDNIFDNLDRIFKTNTNLFYRVGTGELGDSLVYDYLTDYSTKFIDFFANYKNTVFEFKTKTSNIKNIIKKRAPGNIVVGFSVNPQMVVKNEEGIASRLDARIDAMTSLVKGGYKIALHFDPLINIPNFSDEYKNLIDKIFLSIEPSDIVWISIGTFRYTPELKNSIEFNYPETNILSEQFIVDHDKKFRYFKPNRIKLYNTIIEHLRSYESELVIYLCMESPEIWKRTLGFLPHEDTKIDLIFKRMLER